MSGLSIHYRYLSAEKPSAYPQLRRRFVEAEPHMLEVLSGISACQDRLLTFAVDVPPPAPRLSQDWFPTLDALAAYVMVQQRRPDRIIEIGSGHSTRFLSAAIADAGLSTEITCIDPAPRRALEALPVNWHAQRLQDMSLDMFDELTTKSLLFVDSSHVLMDGSDVDIILNQIMPRLPSGLLVHFHDIHLPDAYPEAWGHRHYNEQQAIAPLLAFGCMEILFSSHYVRHSMSVRAEVANCLNNFPAPLSLEGSLWARIRR